MSIQKNWVFTINMPDEPCCEPACWDVSKVQYCIWQLEVGEQGTWHYQGYVQLKQKKRLSTVKNQLCKHAHWEPRRGTHEQAKAYASKRETRASNEEGFTGPWEVGEPVAERQRSDLLGVKRMLDEGVPMKEVADKHFGSFVRYNSGFFKYQLLISERNRQWVTFTTVYWGPPGTGKTRRANHEAGKDAYWLPKPNGNSVFFDGYDGQENVVIDEFFGWLPRSLMCSLCDRYPLMVNIKGGAVPFLAKRIWITSNIDPEEWWRIGLGPMHRRLEGDLGSVINMQGPETWEPPNEELEVCSNSDESPHQATFDSDDDDI